MSELEKYFPEYYKRYKHLYSSNKPCSSDYLEKRKEFEDNYNQIIKEKQAFIKEYNKKLLKNIEYN